MLIKTTRIAVLAGIPLLIAACAKEVPPRSVTEFVENPILLEATMVRCAENRAQLKYDAECVNARDAANRLAAIQDQARRKEFEAQSEQKRQALRRTQEAAAEARRRAAEAQKLREEAAYLAQFGGSPPDGNLAARTTDSEMMATSGMPDSTPGVITSPLPQPDAGEPAGSSTPADLDAIREELKRRQEASQ